MKASNPTADKALQQTLRAWKVNEPLPPRFREHVWQRIAREEAHAPAGLWTNISAWLASAMARPSLAVSYVTLLLLAGLVAGYWQARVDTARASETFGVRYVQMIDPYIISHH